MGWKNHVFGFGAALLGVAQLTGCGARQSEESEVAQLAQPLPSGWSAVDMGTVPTIGGTPAAGSDTYSAATGTYTVTSYAAGVARMHNYFNQRDNARFVHRSFTPPATGDVEIAFRLVSLTGSNNAQVGVMIRQTTADNALAGVGYFRRNEFTGDTPDIPALNELGVTARTRWDPTLPDIDGAQIQSAVRLDPGPDPNGSVDPPGSFYRPIWFRLQRMGGDFSVARSSNGIDWVPFHNVSGGEFSPTGPMLAGFFVAAGQQLPGTDPIATTATIDNVYVGAPRVSVRTSWIGSSFDQSSTGFMSQQLSSFYVAPDGRTFKYFPAVEEGAVMRMLDGANGRLLPFAPSLVGGTVFGGGSAQGALTGNGTSVYFARPTETGGYCIERRNPDLTALTPPTSGCKPVAARVGGMAVGQSAQGVAELFVSELGTLPTDSGRIRVFNGDTLVETHDFSVAARPGPMAVDNNGNLWVIHAAVDYPIVGRFGNTLNPSDPKDPLFTPAVKRYTRLGVVTGEITDAQLTNPVALAVDRRAGMDRMFVADNGVAQNIRVYRALAGSPVRDTTFNAAGAFGQDGGLFGGAAATRGLITSGGNDQRFHALAGVALDNQGNIYVASGAPYVDIRKFAANGTGSSLWSSYGLMNFSNMVDFDASTDGQDVYSARQHFTLNLASGTPGGEWAYKGVSWNPYPPAATPYLERDEHGITARRSGVPLIRTIAGAKFLFVSGQADDDPDGANFGPRGAKGGLFIYRFSGETAVPWAEIRQELLCYYNGNDGQAAKEACGAVDGIPCECDIDPNHQGSIDPIAMMTVWIDSNGNGVQDEPIASSTINPLTPQPDCELRGDCAVFEDSADNFATPSQALLNNPPPRGQATYFDVDSNGDIWLAFGSSSYVTDVATGQPRVLSAAMWQLKRTAGAIPEGRGPEYSMALGTGRVQHELPAGITNVGRLRFQRASGEAMYLMGSDPAGNLVVSRYDNWLTGPRALRATATIPLPALNVDVNATNDFMYLRDPPYKRPSCAELSTCSWSSGTQFQYHAFDVAGDKIFVAEQWGPIHVFDANSGLPVATLIAGPEVSGFQSWDDSVMGIRTFRRANGEYLVASTDSSGHARTLLFRWTPPVLPACSSDTQCSASEFCDAGVCRTRPCNLSDPFGSLAPVLSSPPATADGFTLSGNGLSAYVSSNGAAGSDIFVTTRPSPTAPFGALSPVAPLNTPSDDRGPWLSEDGLRIYYSVLDPSSDSSDIVMASRASAGIAFGTPVAVGGVNAPNWSDEHPFLVPGEQTMYFSSARSGSRDIYVATKSGGAFQAPAALSAVNSPSEDTRPVLTRDGLSLFLGSRRGAPSGDTDGDIWLAQRATPADPFTTPSNVASLNTSGIDFPVSLSADGCTLYLASNRETGLSGTQSYRLYQATRAASLSTITVTLDIVGDGTVTTAPYDCGAGTSGLCSAQRPFGAALPILGSRQALWSGACEANGTPGLSIDATVSFTLGGVCTVTFP